MYPKDRLPRSKSQMPPNLATLFAHVMSRANEGSRGSATHCWDDVLQPASSSGSTSPGPFPMSALDWRKVEAFSLNLQSLIATRHTRCTSNGSAGGAGFSSNGGAASYSSAVAEEEHSSAAATSDEQGSSASSSNGKSILHANGKVKGKAKPVAVHASQAGAATAAAGASAAAAGTGAATPNPAVTWPRHHVPRVTPKEPSRAGEPSAPTKAVGRVASSRRVNGGAEGAVASLAVSRAGPGAFETPSHGSHHVVPPGAPVGGNQRGREHSPSRYPARLRSRRFPQLGGSRESPEPPMPRGFGSGAEAIGEGDQSQRGRRLSPRHSPTCVPRGQGRGLSADQHPHDWHGAVAGVSVQHDHGIERGDDGQNYGVRTRAAPKAGNDLPASMTLPPGACTPHVGTGAVGSRAQMDFRPAPPPIMSAAAAAAPSPKTEVAARPRQVFQDGRSGARVTPVPRSSVGGRNYTDNHVKQLALIEAAVVANATAKDRATYNLPRQGRTLTLTNVFKFVALRGAGAMYNLAMEKQVDAHTGRHSNFFDGKIDARIVGIIKKDIGDEAITKSRKFSKILLSLVAEGCMNPDCDWDHSSFTSDKIANLQARLEVETGTSALKYCCDPVSAGAISAAPSSPLGAAGFAGAGSSGGPANGAPSKRRLDLGKDDDGQTPSPRLKKLKRAARVRPGVESTPTGDGIGNSKSPPKEEDDMRAAEVLQGLKGVGGTSG